MYVNFMVALEEKSNQQSQLIHHLRTMHVCTNFCINPSSRCWHISQDQWKLWHANGAKGKLPKSLGFILWEQECLYKMSWKYIMLLRYLTLYQSMKLQLHDNKRWYTTLRWQLWCQMWMSSSIFLQPSSDSLSITFTPSQLMLWPVLVWCPQTAEVVCLCFMWCTLLQVSDPDKSHL